MPSDMSRSMRSDKERYPRSNSMDNMPYQVEPAHRRRKSLDTMPLRVERQSSPGRHGFLQDHEEAQVPSNFKRSNSLDTAPSMIRRVPSSHQLENGTAPRRLSLDSLLRDELHAPNKKGDSTPSMVSRCTSPQSLQNTPITGKYLSSTKNRGRPSKTAIMSPLTNPNGNVFSLGKNHHGATHNDHSSVSSVESHFAPEEDGVVYDKEKEDLYAKYYKELLASED